MCHEHHRDEMAATGNVCWPGRPDREQHCGLIAPPARSVERNQSITSSCGKAPRPTSTPSDSPGACEARSFDCIVAVVASRPRPCSGLRTINPSAAQDPLAPQLEPEPTLSRWYATRDPLASVPATIAQDAVLPLSSGDVTRIQECASDDCSRLFVDRSHSGQRRWCDSAR
jgi:hypothetical protein